jgi:hypothetical protein
MIDMPNKSPQPLDLVGNERTEFDRVVCGRKPRGWARISYPGASRSDVVPVAVRLQPTELSAGATPRRVATAEPASSSRSRWLFYIAVPARPAAAGSR